MTSSEGSRSDARASVLRPSRREVRPGIDGIYEQSRRVREDLVGLAAAVLETRASWDSALREKLRERPYVGLATAAGIGYVLGAGASPALVRAALGLGSRIAFAVAMRRLTAPLSDAISGRAP